jgi:hypothetical protein
MTKILDPNVFSLDWLFTSLSVWLIFSGSGRQHPAAMFCCWTQEIEMESIKLDQYCPSRVVVVVVVLVKREWYKSWTLYGPVET